MGTKKNRPTRSSKNSTSSPANELDSVYLLKLVLYLMIGCQWIRITTDAGQFPIPVGLIVGLLFATHEHFRIDRKIEFAILLMATFIGFWLPLGLEIVL